MKNNIRKLVKLINSNKFIFYPIVAFAMVLIVGGAVFAGTYLSKSKQSSNNYETSPSVGESSEDESLDTNDLDELDETKVVEELETVPDFEEDEVFEETEETSEETEEESEEDTEETETSKPKKNPYYIKINKRMNTVTVYGLDENGNYTVPVKAMVASTGKATPLGKFNTKVKYTWKLLNGGVWGQYSTRIHGGILFHSVPMVSKSKDAVRYRYYNQLGTTASAGCVRLTVADAKWIFDNCPVGTTVEIFNGNDPGPLGKPSAVKLPLSNGRNTRGWDPTDPDPKNPWRSKQPSIKVTTNTTIERGSNFDIKNSVEALDTAGNKINDALQVSGSVDPNTVGSYEVTYSIKDAVGKTASETVTYKVVDTTAPEIVLRKEDNSIIPTDIGKDDAALKKYAEDIISVTDKGDTSVFDRRKVDIKIETVNNWSYKINYNVADASGNVGSKSITLHDSVSLVVSKVKDKTVKDKNEAKSNTKVQLKNERTGVVKDLASGFSTVETQDTNNKTIKVNVSYNDNVRYLRGEITFSITPKETESSETDKESNGNSSNDESTDESTTQKPTEESTTQESSDESATEESTTQESSDESTTQESIDEDSNKSTDESKDESKESKEEDNSLKKTEESSETKNQEKDESTVTNEEKTE